MTATGSCHVCKKTANHFHYTRPRKDAFDSHEGFWHCGEHGPISTLAQTFTDSDTSTPVSHYSSGPNLNRAERRKRAKSKR